MGNILEFVKFACERKNMLLHIFRFAHYALEGLANKVVSLGAFQPLV
jgi:hypothetical protein